ncbi:MAG: RNA methyltransferase [Alphaproteobacteria bacterium]|nr:RNA methyltransferase [Alphaproteobacteria bacterium]
MSGTDKTQEPVTGGPAIVLVQPQLGQNIGTAARAMWNCGLTDLRLVRPREGWPNDWAVKAASGADIVIEAARVFDSTADAIADLTQVYAATARRRDMIQEILTPRAAAAQMRAQSAAGARIGVLFGPERAGLTNDDMALADRIIEAPLNPAYKSLNLAQAVLLVAYEWYQAGAATPDRQVVQGVTGPASKADLMGLFEHLEGELDACGFLRVREKRPSMVRNIRNIFQRAGLMEQEVKTLRGIITCLTTRRHRD